MVSCGSIDTEEQNLSQSIFCLGQKKKENYIKAMFWSSVGLSLVFIGFLSPCDVSFQVASEEIIQAAN